jgi:hypothetical protein
VLFTVHVPWGEVALRTVWPNSRRIRTAAAVVVGVFGTTISPYLFFWQASEEVEDMQANPAPRRSCAMRARAAPELRRIKWDTWSGMFYSDITAYFIILATAVTLHVAGVTDINTAARPPARSSRWPANSPTCSSPGHSGRGIDRRAGAGRLGRLRLSEAMGWKWGLERKATDARGFYGVIAVSVLAGLSFSIRRSAR